jgi:hypothetical protein
MGGLGLTPCDAEQMAGDAGDEAHDLPLLVVDAANVVGSVPDGWWKDRAKATRRLRDALVPIADTGLTDPELPGPVEVVLVVEGQAKGVEAVPGVRVVAARGSGDDAIVDVVAAQADRSERAGTWRTVVVVTADKLLRSRVAQLGAELAGPRTVRP